MECRAYLIKSDAAQPYTTSSSGRKRANSASYSPEPQKKVKSFSIFDSEASSSNASTSSTVTPSLAVITSLSVSKLEGLPKSELLKYTVLLQNGLKSSKNEVSGMKKSAIDVENKLEAAKAGTMSEEVIQSKAAALAGLMSSEIRKQMKWLPTCKTGRSKWSYSSMVPNPAVMHVLFNLPVEKKVWKQKKLALADFEDITGRIYASIRYGSLRITSAEVTLKYDPEASTFTISGLYGL